MPPRTVTLAPPGAVISTVSASAKTAFSITKAFAPTLTTISFDTRLPTRAEILKAPDSIGAYSKTLPV